MFLLGKSGSALAWAAQDVGVHCHWRYPKTMRCGTEGGGYGHIEMGWGWV